MTRFSSSTVVYSAFVGIVALGLLLSVASPNALAQSKIYAISSYDVTLELLTDSAYLVTEEITYDFQQGTFTFGTRSIPEDNLDRLDNIRVRSSDTQILETTTRTESDRTIIRWTFPERTEPATFTLSYTVHGALVEDDGRNRIHWWALGRETSVPVDTISVTVRLPDDLNLSADDLDIQPIGDRRVQETSDGLVVAFRHGRLDPNQGYDIVVEFPKRLEGRPPDEVNWPRVGAVALAFLVGFLPSILLWRRWRGPRHETRSSEKPDASLPEAAVLLKGATTKGNALSRRCSTIWLHEATSRSRGPRRSNAWGAKNPSFGSSTMRTKTS